MLKLNIKDVLVNARKAFDAGELQIQQPISEQMNGCSYVGPCAIGISVPTELRAHFDSYMNQSVGASITSLVNDHHEVSTDNLSDLRKLQNAHDNGMIVHFERTLEVLETKHGLR